MTLASAPKTAFRCNKHAPTLTFRDEKEIVSRNDGVFCERWLLRWNAQRNGK